MANKKSEEISAAMAQDPLGASLASMAYRNLDQASGRAKNPLRRKPEYHASGWHMSIISGNNLVGLWHSWLGNGFYLGYPKSIEVPDVMITQILGVTEAQPVTYVSATACANAENAENWKDLDKPLEPYKLGGVIAYREELPRQWAKFYGPVVPNGKGRVWIDITGSHTHLLEFPMIDDQGTPQKIQHGYHLSRSIVTVTSPMYNQYAPELPTNDPEALAPYRSKFISLATEIAFMLGRPDKIAIKFAQPKNTPFVPEDLEKEGYSEITWLKGRPGVRIGYGDDVVRARNGDETIILESANSLVPWTATRQVPVGKNPSRGNLYELVDGLFFF